MTAQGEDILAWLDDAISLREQKARRLGGGPFEVKTYPWGGTYLEGAELHEDEIAHIVLHDPASVLRRCAADRELLELHGGRAHSCPAYDYDGDLDEHARFYNHEVCPVVQHLADGYGWTAKQTSPSKGDQVT